MRLRRPIVEFACSLALFGLMGGYPSRAQDPDPPIRVRFDAMHSHTWIETLPQPGLNQYHLLAGPSRAAQALSAMGWQVDVQLEAWDAESLASLDLVVLNLVSADRPAFRVSEIAALREFVQQGAGLIIITDHTNCYFHNHALEPLFDQLDLNLSNATACEHAPYTLGQGGGWILIESFGEHPIVSGIKHVGIQTGGTVDARFAVAWTSPTSWADRGRVPMYGEGKDMGFTGDFHQQPDEPNGPLPVLAAKEFGAGRIVVLGDQNAIGGLFLNYADNRRLWLQCARWAAGPNKEPTQQEPTDRLARGLAADTGRSLVWCVEPLADRNIYWGSADRQDHYHAFALLNKYADARATDRCPSEAQWMIVPSEPLMKQEHWRNQVREFLEQPGKHAVVWREEGSSNPADWIPEVLLNESTASVDSEWIGTWTKTNGSTLELWKNTKRWTNRELLGPEASRNDADVRLEEAMIGPLWERGLKRVKSLDQTIDWPGDGP